MGKAKAQNSPSMSDEHTVSGLTVTLQVDVSPYRFTCRTAAPGVLLPADPIGSP